MSELERQRMIEELERDDLIRQLQAQENGGEVPQTEEAFGKGLAKGATFDFSDEIAAGFKSGIKWATKGGNYKELYKKQLQKERGELKRLEQKYPLAFISGELTGAIGSSFLVPIPGTTGAKTAAMAPKLVRAGARLLPETIAQSVGAAEAEYGTKQFFKEVGAGTAAGLAGGGIMGGAGKATGKLLQKGKAPLETATKYIANVLFDLPHEYTKKLLNPKTAQKILNPKSPGEIVESISEMVGTMGEHATALSLKAADTLDNKANIPVADILDTLKMMPSVARMEDITLSEATKAKKVFKMVAENLTKLGGTDGKISQRQVKSFIQNIDDEIPWNHNEWKKKDEVLTDIRKFLDHDVLKSKNKNYAEAMKPVDELMRTRDTISSSFSLKRDGYKLQPSDTTYSKINNFFAASGISRKPVTEKALKDLQTKFPGKNILEDIEITQIASRVQGGVTSGSRNVVAGGLLGGLLTLQQGLGGGSIDPTTTAALVMAGFIKDKYGRLVGSRAIPKMSGAIQSSDEMLRKVLDKASPEQIQRVMRTLGRVPSVQTGVEGQTPRQDNLPPLLPRR